jgi:hypothetical protein
MSSNVLRLPERFGDVKNAPTDMLRAYQSELHSLPPSFTVNIPVPNDKDLLVTILLAEIDPS